MKERDFPSYIISVILKKISYLAFLLLLTFPLTIIIISKWSKDIILNSIILICIVSWIITFFKAWHIYFDWNIFRLIEQNSPLSVLDGLIIDIFNRKTQIKKTLEERIKWSINLIKKFLIFLALHLLSFFILVIYFLFIA